MTADDLNAPADRASKLHANVPGYTRTTVRSYTPPALSHEPSSNLEAKKFQGDWELIAAGRYFIDPSDPEIVLQRG